jgi:Ca2+-binding EF-hand superfamily protein
LDADGDGSISKDELSTLLSATDTSSSTSTSSADSDKNALYASLVQALMKQYETGAGYEASSVGSQISIAA